MGRRFCPAAIVPSLAGASPPIGVARGQMPASAGRAA